MRLSMKQRLALLVVPLAVLASGSFAGRALAQESPAGPPAPAPVQAPAPPDLEPKPSAPPSQSLGPVERLPPDAYPAPRTRGIYGGSLWMTFHGLQWPYYPKTGIGVSGYGWVDTAYQQLAPGESLNGSPGLAGGQVKSKSFLQQARVLLRTTPTWSDGNYFMQLQAEFVATKLSTSNSSFLWSADDAWVRVGKWNTFDVQLGRFEAWEVYHLGMGLDLYTFERLGATGGTLGLANLYLLDAMLYRQDSVGQGAIHIYPKDWLRFEIGAHYGPEGGGTNTVGVRPVAVVDLGWLKLKGGLEFRDSTAAQEDQKNETRLQGGGAAVQCIVDPYVEFGVNGAYATTDTRRPDGQIDAHMNFHTYSLGGFANARVVENLLVGAGLDYTFQEDQSFDPNVNRNDSYNQWQTFGAVQYNLFHQLFIKAVVAYALANENPTPLTNPTVYKNEMISGRLRVLGLF
jgi:hypothetical protein